MSNAKHILRNARNLSSTASSVVHPLNTQAKRKTLSLGDETGLTSVGVHMNIIAPGDATTEPHTHEFVDEFICVLSGDATLYMDAEEYTVTAGDFIGFPAHGPAHWLKNTGNVDLVYLVGGNRPDFDICNYPRLERRLYIVKRPDGRHREYVDCKDIKRG